MLQVWPAGARRSLDMLRVASLFVGHKANPSTFGFTLLFCPAWKKDSEEDSVSDSVNDSVRQMT